MPREKQVDPLAPFKGFKSHEESDRYFLAVTPKVYEWLQWILTLAAVTYVSEKSESVTLRVLVALTYALTFAYYNSFFYQFKFTGLPLVKGPRAARTVSIVLAAALGLTMWFIVSGAVDALVAMQP